MSRKRTISYQTNEGRRKKELLEKKLKEIDEILPYIQEEIDLAAAKRKSASILESVCSGLYIETEKLSKKNPNLPSTSLIVEQVNQVIKEVKETADTDPYIQRLNQFFPAGDNPEIQDVVVVLKQILQGLLRLKPVLETMKTQADAKKTEAHIIRTSLKTLLQENTEKYANEIPNGKYFLHWFNHSEFGYFDFDKLTETNLLIHFNYEQKSQAS